MNITNISVQDFRSLSLFSKDFDKRIIIFCGNNNAGKTSVLEAIYFCSNLRSFKSVSNNEIINNKEKSFKISLNFCQNNLKSNIFVEKSLKSSKVTMNSKKISKASLAVSFPCYFLVFGFNNILLNESSYRRDFIDSGMFHVEPGSIQATKKLDTTVKQRNYILKSKQTSELDFWDTELIKANSLVSSFRQNYFSDLCREVEKILDDLVNIDKNLYSDISTLELSYNKGWAGNSFSEELALARDKDLSVGHTTIGSHRSDFIAKSKSKPVKESGSMSTLVLSCLILYLAKINIFHVKHGYKPVLLIDDLFFGIDNKNLNTVVKLLVSSSSNIVLTAPNIYRDVLIDLSRDNKEIEIINMENT